MGEAPEIADSSGDDETDADDVVDEHENNASGDVNEAEVELTDDDLGGDLFSGVEEAESGDESESSPDTSDGSGDGDESDLEEVADGLDGNAAAMEDTFNEGAARLAVVGLTDDDFEDSDLTKSSLQEEFEETFQAFRLGYFGSRALEEYVLDPADEDVSPAWGLLGSVLMTGALVVWLRPDGDEAIGKAREKISGFTGGDD